jgi:hypothetical protein
MAAAGDVRLHIRIAARQRDPVPAKLTGVSTPSSPWPRFATVELSGSDLPERLAAQFLRLVVPSKEIGGITAEPKLRVVLAPDGSELIQFGRYSYGPICLDPATGHVVDMVESRGEIVRGPLLVNSSLEQFIQTTKAATELFPYHEEDPDGDFEAAANALRARLEPIDPQAWSQDGFWDTFYWDVAIGDYSPSQFETRSTTGGR